MPLRISKKTHKLLIIRSTAWAKKGQIQEQWATKGQILADHQTDSCENSEPILMSFVCARDGHSKKWQGYAASRLRVSLRSKRERPIYRFSRWLQFSILS